MSGHDALAASAWVRRFAGLIRPGGVALDLACGSGRHARYLLERGLRVVALDRDAERLSPLRDLAGVEVVCADIECGPWPLAGRVFDGIVATNYLHRPLFATLHASLAEGGVLIYETFAAGNERYGRPANPDFLLRRDELLACARPLQVVAFEQGLVARPAPAVVQRICAVRTGAPVPID
ncbi:MAG: class I SAM-dependent methyltransferase [Burkholderiales bacterium]|nr:class I SAM-dependent methyltransferase [Burkholderiales bacterium]